MTEHSFGAALARLWPAAKPGIVDGVYRPMTMAAVTAFQITHRLVPDGEVGGVTAAALGVPWP